MNEKTLGQIAFEAYRLAKNNIAYDGTPIPEWSKLDEGVRSGWESAAGGVVAAYFGRDPRASHASDDREAKPL